MASLLSGKVTACGRFSFSMCDDDVLGVGTHAEVFRGLDRDSGSAVAIKVLKRRYTARAKEEARLMACLPPHANVVALVAATEWVDAQGTRRAVLVSDLYDEDMAHAARSQALAPASAAYVMCQMLQGLAHVHAAGLAHHDIKAENVYCTSRGAVALGDFDLATQEVAPVPGAPPPQVPCVKRGTMEYMPPELRYGTTGAAVEFDPFQGDVWACGVLAATLLTTHGVSVVNGGVVMEGSSGLPAAAQDFLHSALIVPVAARPSVEMLLRHPWLATRKEGPLTFQRSPGGAAVAGVGEDGAEPPPIPCILRVFACGMRARNRVVPLSHPHASPVKAQSPPASSALQDHASSQAASLPPTPPSRVAIPPPPEHPTLTNGITLVTGAASDDRIDVEPFSSEPS